VPFPLPWVTPSTFTVFNSLTVMSPRDLLLVEMLFLGLMAVVLVSGTPYHPQIQKRSGTFGSPCAQVAESSAAAMRENVFGNIVISCLKYC